jgi:hypothetical protein
MKINAIVVTVAVGLTLSGTVVGAPLYLNRFETDTTAGWTVNKQPATTDEAHDFFFDYSTVGIPPAPNSGPLGTRGLKLQANQSSGVFGGMSVSPTGKSFTGDYEVLFDWWANFNGAFPVGGSGSTQLSTFGVLSDGASAQWPGSTPTVQSVLFGGTGDGNSGQDWRAYTSAGHLAPGTGVYAAGTGTSPDARNHNHPYYAGFGGNTAPAAQTLLYPQQTGATLVGSAGMEWHEVSIKKTGSIVTWTVGGTLIATIDASTATTNGNNIFFGHSDTNSTSSTDPNDVNLLFTLIDNVRVVVPEPNSFALLVIALLSLVARRR